MIVRRLEQIAGGRFDVGTSQWRSRRLLVRDDGLPFSVHDTVVAAGVSLTMRYSAHVEVVYCIAGRGTLRNDVTGIEFAVRPGLLYALDSHEPHTLSAHTELRGVCVFTPACRGDEIHDATGGYRPLPGRGARR